MRYEKPERLQDPEISFKFRVDYETLLAAPRKMSNSTFLEFNNHAYENAPDSVLAACVYDIVRAAKKEGGSDDVPSFRRRTLQHAGEVATQVEELDALYRDPDKADELVLYTYEKIKDPDKLGTFTGFHLTVAEKAYVEHFVYRGDEKRQDIYGFRPEVRYGADSTNIFSGKAEDWIQGSADHFEMRHLPNYDGFFGQGMTYLYADFYYRTMWGRDLAMPKITAGREAIMGQFEQWLDEDYTEAYTENRYRRPSYTLFRQACYLGDLAVDEMTELADKKHMLGVWREQMLDEDAIRVVKGLEKIAAEGKKVADLDKLFGNPFANFISGRRKDLEWLNLTKQQFYDRTLRHAEQLGLRFEDSEVDAAIEQVLDLKLLRRWKEHKRRALTGLPRLGDNEEPEGEA